MTKRKPFNPLQPQYQFIGNSEKSSTENYHPFQKFIRNQIDITDIEGAQPTKPKLKSIYEPEKIKGSFPKQSIREIKSSKEDLNKIIRSKKEKYIRDTNPLNPEYKLNYSLK